MNINQALDRLRGGGPELNAIADAIGAEIERLTYRLEVAEMDRFEQQQEIKEKDAEIERLNSENTLLRAGDTCARHCEGVAFRHEAQRLKADNQRLEDLVSGMKGIANTQGEIIAEQNEKIEMILRLFSDDPIEVTSARAVLALKEKEDVYTA